MNIRSPELGVQQREKCRRPGGNLHCLLCFRSDVVEENPEVFLSAQEAIAEEEKEEVADDVAAVQTKDGASNAVDE